MNNNPNIAHHARDTYNEVRAEGPAARPLDYPPPQVRRGVRVNALVVHPATGERDVLSGVIHRESYRRNTTNSASGNSNSKSNSSNTTTKTKTTTTRTKINVAENAASPTNRALIGRAAKDRLSSANKTSRSVPATTTPMADDDFVAYFPQRRLQDAIFGSVWACLVLHRHHGQALDDAARAAGVEPGDPAAPIVWEIAGYHVAIKMVEWSRVHQNRGRLLEDPIKEIAAMQLIGTDHPHVLGSLEVLQDDEFLYSVMPYAKGGDLFGYVVNESRGEEGGMDEPVARYWFKQILQGLYFLQSKGICHRDLSLENILVDEDNCLVIDFGMCLRVPYTSQESATRISSISDGLTRRLIRPQGTCGKHNYMSPEIFENRESFDGFAIDLWAAGVILYIMLTGFPPYDHATLSDQRFEIIVNGQLVDQLQSWDIHLGEQAGNLLQSMLQLRPNDRLTLAQVMEHEWVTDPNVTHPQPSEAPY